jgi:sensor histidine kinase YesM
VNADQAPSTPHGRRLAWLVTFALGLAGIEWWAGFALDGHAFGGPLTGAAAFALLLALARRGLRRDAPVAAAWWAALSSMLELALAVALVGSFTAIAVATLPLSISRRFLQGDAGTDFVLLTIALLSLVVAARGWMRYAARAADAERARTEVASARAALAERDQALARSELQLLRAQVEPHFLGNTLAHVEYLTLRSPQDAHRMTGHLIRFLRSAVFDSRGGATTLGSEVDSGRAYLEIMKVRMGDRLSVIVEMDEALSDMPFPPLLLQTLLENAITHGVEPKVGPVTVAIRAHYQGEDAAQVVLEVQDNGVGLRQNAPTSGTGEGLKSVRARLRAHFGNDAALSIGSAPGGGVSARIVVPRSALTP